MSEKPLVSILIPCYNHENFLDDCLNSILEQTYENIELLICDDCSPDNSFEKIKSYEQKLLKRFKNVVILKNETNLGVTKNVNRMLTLANGKYIKTLASDDALSKNAIAEMADFLQNNSQISVVISNGIKVTEDSHYPDFSSLGKIYDAAPNLAKEGFFERVCRCNEISAPAAMVRKSLYDKFGGYDESVKIEDFEFWLRVLKDGETEFGFLDRDLVFYRINANSMSSLEGNARLEARQRLFFNSEIESLYKYKNCFKSDVFAEIVIQRLFSARWFAVEMGLKAFSSELEEMWRSSPLWKDISLNKKLFFKFAYFKTSIKKSLKK